MNYSAEWIEPDGEGGFAMGTLSGIRTRRHHGLLVAPRTSGSTDRFVLVNGFDASIQTSQGHYFLTSQYYAPGVIDHDARHRIESFRSDPWPHWTYNLEDGVRIEHEIFYCRERQLICLSWRLLSSSSSAFLYMRPLLSGRKDHDLHEENAVFNLDSVSNEREVRWSPYREVPAIHSFSNGHFSPDPIWYRHFIYEQELERGLEAREDLASPGVFRWDLAQRKAIWFISARGIPPMETNPEQLLEECAQIEGKRRQKLNSRLARSADIYFINSPHGKTLLSGYPWSPLPSRGTFISLRGLGIANPRLMDTFEIISQWSEHLSEGMLPDFIPGLRQRPQYNSVDASLWMIIVIHEFLQKTEKLNPTLFLSAKNPFHEIIQKILTAYQKGSRSGIGMDPEDGLLKCGDHGTHLTWMDSQLEGEGITSRVGKPVEIQALWLNALRISEIYTDTWRPFFAKGLESFLKRFWMPDRGYLYDVIDCAHIFDANDPTLRPNQLFAIGGLPFSFLDPEKSKSILSIIEQNLLTPLGLQTLTKDEHGYHPSYSGNEEQRNRAYHQGTVWPWLMGPFIEAWMKNQPASQETRKEAKDRFVLPLLNSLEIYGLGHLPEIADAEAPHTPRGCPFHSWSLGELIRIQPITT